MLRSMFPLLALLSAPAAADVRVAFTEGAPKDRFSISHDGDCPLPAMTLTIDLSTAPSGLIFDVTGSGAGVQVFQPFELVAGAEYLRAMPNVLDGQSAVQLDLSGLGTAQTVAFTIDVDDTGGGREITVSGSEIAGAEIRASIGAQTLTGTFSDAAVASIPLAACLS